MTPDPVVTGVSLAGQALPPAATLVDAAFAWGAVVLLVVLIVWQGRSAPADPNP